MNIDSNYNPPLAYNVPNLAKASGRGRSVIYQEIASGRLVARKAGRRTLILHNDAVAWLNQLPTIITVKK